MPHVVALKPPYQALEKSACQLLENCNTHYILYLKVKGSILESLLTRAVLWCEYSLSTTENQCVKRQMMSDHTVSYAGTPP